MTKSSKAPARVLAVIALIAAFVVVLVLVSSALDDGSGAGSGGSGGTTSSNGTQKQPAPKDVPKVYVIKNGDTLISIAHETGVAMATIRRLNPEVDPQILISGEKIKLR